MKPNLNASDPVMEWLGAYLDGALSVERRAWVEDHLETCDECREALAELRALSMLLHADPEPAPRQAAREHAAREFAAQVLDRLPPEARPDWRAQVNHILRAVPLGLFGLWAFLQAVVWAAGGMLFLQVLFPGLGLAGWLGDLSLLGSLVDPGEVNVLTVLIPWPVSGWLIEMALTALVALLFLAWLASIWSMRRAEQNI